MPQGYAVDLEQRQRLAVQREGESPALGELACRLECGVAGRLRLYVAKKHYQIAGPFVRKVGDVVE